MNVVSELNPNRFLWSRIVSSMSERTRTVGVNRCSEV